MAGNRYNQGKVRLDLLPVGPIMEIGKVFTFGAEKYAPRNWEKGLKWSTCIASLKRHIAAFESGEDFDPESGLLHLAHAGCNILFLLEYYKTHPDFDDRQINYPSKRIALDTDEVLAGFVEKYCEKYNISTPYYWEFDYSLPERLLELDKDFWLSLPVIEMPNFDPVAYVSNRSFPVEWTQEWLSINGFPAAPVYHTQNKLEVLRELEVDIFIDDRFSTFRELNQAGLCTFLLSRPHNRHYEVGYKRLNSINDAIR